MITIALLATLAQDSKVSLDIRGERLIVCAPKIAQALGMPQLTIRAPFQEEVAAIRVTNVDRQTLKQKIEQAFRGTFIQKENEWTFEQTIEQKAQERANHFDSLTKGHQEFIDAAKKFVASAAPFNQTEAKKLIDFQEKISKEKDGPVSDKQIAEWRKMRHLNPTTRFAVEIISKLRPEHWRQVDVDGRRTIYSLNPTNVQFPMPVNLNELLPNLITRQKLYSQIGTDRFKDNEERDGYLELFKLGEYTPDDFYALNVVIEDTFVEVISYNQAGKNRLREKIFAETLMPGETDADAVKKKYAKLGPKLSPVAEEYLKLIDVYEGDREEYGASPGQVIEKPISPELKAQLMDPTRIDPLAVAVPEVLFGSNPKLNIVANLNPNMVRYRNLAVAFLAENQSRTTYHKVEDGWLTLGLPDAFPMRQKVLERTRMAQVFRMFLSGAYPRLEQQADYARELTADDEPQNLCHLNLLFLLRGTQIEGPAYSPIINLYGALSAQERAIASKQPVPIGGLNQSFLWTLADCLIYQKPGGMYPRAKQDWDPAQAGTTPIPEQVARLERTSKLYESGFFTEPTYRHPNGLTTDMTLGVSEKQNYLISVKLRSPVDGRTEQTVSPMSLGVNLFRKDFPSLYASSIRVITNYDLDKLNVVTYREVQLKVSPPGDWEYAVTHREPHVHSAKTFTTTTLPPEVQKMVDEGIRLAKQAHEDLTGSGAGRKVPPPMQEP